MMETIFSKIIRKEIPAQILYEDDRVIAFYDIKPQRPGHFLVVPKTYAANLLTISDSELSYLMQVAVRLAKQEIKARQVGGFNLVVNNGKAAGQEVMHAHVHIVPSSK